MKHQSTSFVFKSNDRSVFDVFSIHTANIHKNQPFAKGYSHSAWCHGKSSKEATRTICDCSSNGWGWQCDMLCLQTYPISLLTMTLWSAKQTLLKLKDEVEPHKIKFFAGVREFFVGAAAYITQTFLWGDPVLEHYCFVDFEKRKKVSFQSVEFFFVKVSRASRSYRWTVWWVPCVPMSTRNSSWDTKQLEIKCEWSW